MHRKRNTIDFWVGRLPHWEVEDGRYFVTIHLSGAIPRSGQQRIHEISAGLNRIQSDDERLRIQRQIFGEMEAWLDRSQYVPQLRLPEIGEMVCEAIEHRARQGVWQMFEYVVMPNHVHLFFELAGQRLKDSLEAFKEWTGRQACKFVRPSGERFWQREGFDHWSRCDEEDERIMEYIRRNPEKAGLAADYRTWPYGSWRSGRGGELIDKPSPAEPAGPTKTSPAEPAGPTKTSPAEPAGPT
jgi:REP element-mobilizing transposase RayT